MKKLAVTLFLLASILLVGCNHKVVPNYSLPETSNSAESSDSSSSSSSDETETPPDETTYQITYQWNEYGTLYDGIENFPEAMKNGVDIATTYVVGKALALPKLNAWQKNVKIVYEFDGWYYDEALTNKVDGDILPSTQTGDITLYAKFIAYIS